MEHTLITTIVLCLVSAFLGGLAAKKLGLPTILGYLLAGMMIGPHTPGFVADIKIAQQLAEIGIILLMFGVGLHFSLSDLRRVKNIALPGALFQMLVATVIGMAAAMAFGYSLIAALVFGFALSVASTVVLLRTLEQRKELTQNSGKIAVGWLIIEDIAMVLALVLLPVVANLASSGHSLTTTIVLNELLGVLLKITGFAVVMMMVGRRLLPWLLVSIAQLRSRELATLGTLAIALGFAYLAYTVFGASFALGAFLAGMVLSESEIGHKAAEQSLPMRDAFAVIFFVSAGMLFDPRTLLAEPLMVLITLLIIVLGKGVAALIITRLFQQTRQVSYTVAVSLAQIGEFSFILAGMSLSLGLLPASLYNIILAGALLSIALNPLLFRLLDRLIIRDASQHSQS